MAWMIAANVLQLAVALLMSPLLAGILNRLKEFIQAKRGPSIFQPYYDLWKRFHKDEVVSQETTWIFRAAPYVAFVTPLLIVPLIPVLTTYPLFFAFVGDMLAVGFIFGLGSFFLVLAAVDTANPYGAMGASRTRMVSFLLEPVAIMVLFTVSFAANSTIPYIVQQVWVHPPVSFFAPSHLLLVVAFVAILIGESGKIPVDNPSGHFELAMIDESKSLEYSGPGAALVKWAGYLRFFVVSIVLVNVLVSPWGLASTTSIGPLLLAIALVFVKLLVLLCVFAIIESSFAKLRLFRISDYAAGAFVVSLFAMLARAVGA